MHFTADTTADMQVWLPGGGDMESIEAKDTFLVIGDPGIYNNTAQSHIINDVWNVNMLYFLFFHFYISCSQLLLVLYFVGHCSLSVSYIEDDDDDDDDDDDVNLANK